MGRTYSYQSDPPIADKCWGISCPYCGTNTHEVSQTLAGVNCLVRRRKCFNGHTFVTQEGIGEQSTFQQADRRMKRKRGKMLNEKVEAIRKGM